MLRNRFTKKTVMPISTLTLESPALETLYDSQFTFSTQLIKPNYLALRLLITSTLKKIDCALHTNRT